MDVNKETTSSDTMTSSSVIRWFLILWANAVLLRTIAGVLREKIVFRAILKETRQTILYIVGKVNKCRFQKKNTNCGFLQFRKRKSQSTAKMTMCHSIELIGYQIQVHWQKITAQC